MVSRVAVESPKLDKVWWSLIFIILATAVGANFYFADRSLLIRIIGLLIVIVASAVLALRTTSGQKMWTLWLESVQEVKKVVWPTRQETIQTTLAVLAMVLVMGILLWTADFLLLRTVGWLTGRWGA
jgi:preprotein translocase subunit SecE